MKRTAHAVALAAALNAGCVATDKIDVASQPHMGVAGTMKQAPNTVGPWNEPVPAASAKANWQQPKDEIVQAKGHGDKEAGVRPVNHKHHDNCSGPSGPVPRPSPIDGAVAATGALVQGPGSRYGSGRTSVRFAGPTGMKVAWYNGQGSMGGFTQTMVEAPGRYNFPQGAVYRLKLADFPNRPGVELYPTLEVIPASLKTSTFLAHSAVPVSITEEDLEQVAAGNFVVKVIYLPDPAYQDLAASGPDEIVSSRLEPGVDPVAEATRRGSVLLILRLGNIDLEAPNSPRMDSPPGAPIQPSPARGMISGPISGPMSGPMSGPISGPMSGPISGPMSGPMPGPISGPVSGPINMPQGAEQNAPQMAPNTPAMLPQPTRGRKR